MSKRSFALVTLGTVLSIAACSASGGSEKKVGGSGASSGSAGDGGSSAGGTSQGGTIGVGGGGYDADLGPKVTLRGTIWSPGADLPSTSVENRFPIPGAAVMAFANAPSPLPQALYCNECVEIASGVPNVLANPVDGTFELDLAPGTWFLTIQKGEFRRVRQIQVVDDGSGVMDLEPTDPSAAKPEITTLPHHTELGLGDNIPKVAIVDGAYEDQEPMWSALGFDYGNEIKLYETDYLSSDAVDTLMNDYAQLSQYNLIVFPCGADMPTGGSVKQNLERYVREGGKLYIDDFSYDYAEQVWPDFLSYFVRGDGFGGQTDAICGDGSSTSPGTCNDWDSSYDFIGIPGDPDFAGWLALPSVNPSGTIQLEGAWNSIYALGEGQIGVDDTGAPVRAKPKVWMSGDTPAPQTENPATVSWDYHCGKVLFTVYHTHTEDSSGSYQLALQEKIMMYLIMEIQTCSDAPVVK
ncbi:MAG: hypothetical protein H6718_30295 [Polyangiaceae bacterium]|nr:hypothetical protein [Polyangiaceae bacterium]